MRRPETPRGMSLGAALTGGVLRSRVSIKSASIGCREPARPHRDILTSPLSSRGGSLVLMEE